MATKGLTQAYKAQDATYETLMRYVDQVSKAGQVTPQDASAISTLVTALDRAMDRVRIHRGKPLPGVARQAGPRRVKGGRDVSAFLASLAPQQEPGSQGPDHGSAEPAGDQEQSSQDPDQEQSSGT